MHDGTAPPEHTEGGDQGDSDDDGGDDQGGRRNREITYRRRAQNAERERDDLRAQLDTLHRQMVTDIATAAGLPDVELLESAGHELASFISDDGTVDRERVSVATAQTIEHYGIRRRPRPNPQEGAHGAPVRRSSLSDTINKALGR